MISSFFILPFPIIAYILPFYSPHRFNQAPMKNPCWFLCIPHVFDILLIYSHFLFGFVGLDACSTCGRMHVWSMLNVLKIHGGGPWFASCNLVGGGLSLVLRSVESFLRSIDFFVLSSSHALKSLQSPFHPHHFNEDLKPVSCRFDGPLFTHDPFYI